MSFKDLKKQSSLGSLTQKLVKEVEKMNNTGGGADERLWKPEVDKTVMVMLLLDSYHLLKVRIFRGQRYILTHSKVLVGGTSKTH